MVAVDNKQQCWPYEQGVPVITVTFSSQGITLTKTLQVDTGFSGWFLHFERSYQLSAVSGQQNSFQQSAISRQQNSHQPSAISRQQ